MLSQRNIITRNCLGFSGQLIDYYTISILKVCIILGYQQHYFTDTVVTVLSENTSIIGFISIQRYSATLLRLLHAHCSRPL